MNFEGPLRPHAFDCTKLSRSQEMPWAAPELLHNASVRVRFWRCESNMPALARNADGDELLFVHAGRGELYCDYGHLSFEAGETATLRPDEPVTPLDNKSALANAPQPGAGYFKVPKVIER